MNVDLFIVTLIFAALFLIQSIRLRSQKIKTNEQQSANEKILSQKKSSEVRTGQIAEQLAPFVTDFGHDPKKAHFLGQPIDYIIFEETGIVFKEIKSGGAQLNATQKLIKQLIQDKKIYWEEMRIDGKSTLKEPPTAEV